MLPQRTVRAALSRMQSRSGGTDTLADRTQRVAEVVSKATPAQVAPFFRGFDHGLVHHAAPGDRRNRSVFDDLHLDAFEGNAKHQWLDVDENWCHLCREPFGGPVGVHLSDRDHVCLGLFLMLWAAYPRESDPRQVLHAAMQRHGKLHASATGNPLGLHALHTTSDAVRRSELEAILIHLSEPGPNQALTHTLQGEAPLALWSSGERIFKVNLSRLVAMSLPPMAPGVHSTFTQKCWGRSNQERMYEALNIASIHRNNGVEPKQTRDTRAFFMRSMIWELHTAKDNRNISHVARLLVDEVLRQLSFELMFLQSMTYMNRVQIVVRQLGGRPTMADLHKLNSL